MPLAEAALSFVAQRVLDQVTAQGLGSAGAGMGARVRTWLGREPQQLACAVALARAEVRFAEAHPDWEDALFDATFLGGPAAPILARSLTRDELALADDLADAWATAAVGGRTGARHRDDALAPAADFLRMWREELGRQPNLRPLLDSRSGELAAEGIERLVQQGDASLALVAELKEELARALVEVDRSLTRSRYPALEDLADWPSRQKVRSARPLTGREWVFDELADFAARNDSGYLRIVAEAGLGKTALAAAIAQERSAAAFFFGASAGRVHPEQCLRHLCVELIERYGLPYDRLPDRVGADAGFLSRLLHEATLRQGPVWVVIDALDEAQLGAGRAEVMPLPDELPSGAFVVLTHRPGVYEGALVADGGTAHETLRITPQDSRQRDDVLQFVASEVERPDVRAALDREGVTVAEFADRLAEASEGNFMYVTFVLHHVTGNMGPPLDLARLPHGLHGYYRRMWDVIAAEADRDWQSWSTLHLRVIEYLAVAGEPVTASWLADHIGRPASEVQRRALSAWERFLQHEEDGVVRRWRIVHQSFRDYLASTEEVDLSAAHARVADHYAPRARWAAHDGYALRHLSAHLRLAGRVEELFALVDEPAWRMTQFKADETGSAYLTDVGQAWSAAVDADAAAAERGESPPLLLAEIRLALAVAEVHQSHQDLSGELLLRALESGTWTVDQVLAVAKLIPEPSDRADALATLVPMLPSRLLAEVEDVTRFVPDATARVHVAAAVAERLPEDQRRERLGEFLSTVPTLGDQEQALTLEIVAPLLEPEDAATATRVAYAMQDVAPRTRALSALVPALEPRARYEAIEHILGLALEIDSQSIADALTRMAPFLVASQLKRALAIAESLSQIRLRSEVTAALAPRLPEEQRESEAVAALEAAGESTTPRVYAESVEALAPFLPAAARDKAVQDALLAAEHAPGAIARARALKALAPLLPEEELAHALELMHQSLAERQPGVRARALALLAPYLGVDQLKEAVATATGDALATDRGSTMAALAPHLPDEIVPLALRRFMHADPAQRVRVLLAATPYLDEASREDALAEAMLALRQVSEPRDRFGLLRLLARRVPEDQRATQLADALETVSGPIDEVTGRHVGEVVCELASEPWSRFGKVWERLHGSAREGFLEVLAGADLGPPPRSAAMSIAVEWGLSHAVVDRALEGLPATHEARRAVEERRREEGERWSSMTSVVALGLSSARSSGGLLDFVAASADEHARERHANEVVAALQGGEDEAEVALVQALGATVALMPREAAARALRPLTREPERCSILASLLFAPYLPRETVSRGMRKLRERDPDRRGEIAMAALGRTPPGSKLGLLWVAVGWSDHLTDTADPLGQGDIVTPARAAEVLEYLADITDPELRYELMREVAAEIPDEDVPQALRIVLGEVAPFLDQSLVTATLGALADRLDSPQAGQVLTWLPEVGDEWSRLDVLRVLGDKLPPADVKAGVELALATSSTGVSTALDISERLSSAEVLAVLEGHATQPGATALLEGLAPLLETGDLKTLVRRLSEAPASFQRDRHLAAVAPHVPDELLVQLVSAITDESTRSSVIGAGAGRVATTTAGTLMEQAAALKAAQPRARALAALAPRVPADLVERALGHTATMPATAARAQCLAALAPRLPPQAVPRALTLTVAVSDAVARAEVLAALGQNPSIRNAVLYRHCAETVRLAAARGGTALARCVDTLGPVMQGP